ncbi:MAG: efflux RND transporter periplasmic adaptor subunit [Anaerolineaceae bacterium]|nr:efflux RND transporter periplasmic adaptor subunit [Anaerolineaceae bacterium]
MKKIDRKTIFFLLLMAAALCGCSQRSVPTENEILTVPAGRKSIEKTVIFIGNVTGGQTASLNWSTKGVIDTVNVKLGDSVAEGQVLASLAGDSLSTDVVNAEIPLITALDELDDVLYSETAKAQAYKDLKDKEGAMIDSEKAQESLKYPRAVTSDIKYWSEQTQIARETYEEALGSFNDAVSWRNSPEKGERNEYDARRKKMLTALNKYAEVYNNYLYYSGKATENDKAQAAADIEVAKAAYENALKVFQSYSVYPREKDLSAVQLKIENAQNTYNRRNIVASINGVVTEIYAREGDYVTQSAAAFRLDSMDHLYIPLNISEIDILEIHDGMKARIVLDAEPDVSYDGIVTTVSSSGTESGSRVTFQTMVEILEPDEKVKIGMTGEVNLILDEAENALIVPANAVYSDQGTWYVGISNGTTCNEVPVTIGITTDTLVQISSGFVNEGDLICVPSLDNSILRDMGLENSSEGNNMQTPAEKVTETVPPSGSSED